MHTESSGRSSARGFCRSCSGRRPRRPFGPRGAGRYTPALAVACLLGLMASVTPAADTDNRCALTIDLVDAGTGRSLAGLVRFKDADGEPVTVKEPLLNRGVGMGGRKPISTWSVLVAPSVVKLPRQRLTIEAISGLETERAELALDLRGKATAEAKVPLRRFYTTRDKGLRSGNTHLHLMRFTRALADRYLLEIPKADGLDVVFLSYLERVNDDIRYISNRYSKADLERLSQCGVLFGNGEEHRHNLAGYGQGFGHIMLLDILRLIHPVSIGPGIMKSGTDGIPIRRAIDAARRDGATVIWCHNNWGMEDIPNWVTGRLQAQNIFDGGSKGSYKDSFYRYLNAGLKVPFSTGTGSHASSGMAPYAATTAGSQSAAMVYVIPSA